LDTREGWSQRKGKLIDLIEAITEDLNLGENLRPEDFDRVFYPRSVMTLYQGNATEVAKQE